MSGDTKTIRNHLLKAYKIELQTASEQFKLQHKRSVREISDWVLTNPSSNKHRKPTYESHELNPDIL